MRIDRLGLATERFRGKVRQEERCSADSEKKGHLGVGERKITLIVPDARDETVRRRVARSFAQLAPEEERDAMDRIESVSILNERDGDEQ